MEANGGEYMKSKKGILKVVLATAIAMSLILLNSLILYSQPSNMTIEGEDSYFVTGESYPTTIQVAGYNSRDNLLYINSDFETTKTVQAGETATFSYYIEVFDSSGAELGTLGSYATPETVPAAVGATTVSVTNEAVTLTGALTAGNRTIVTIKGVAIV